MSANGAGGLAESPPSGGIDPRLRVLYLFGVAVGLFFVHGAVLLAAGLLLHAGLWILVGLQPHRLVRQVVKLWGFALFIIVSYGVTSLEPETDRWVTIPWLHLSLNATGMEAGGLMILRLLTIVLASQIARAGDPRSIAQGLKKLGAPPMVAVPLDTVLALLGQERGRGSGRGDGSGGGGGMGGGRGESAPGGEGFLAGLKRLSRGDVAPLLSRMDRQIDRAERHLDAQEMAPAEKARVRDIAIIAGVALTMLGIKALKILPSIPFAPGHKLVILTPLYVVARILVKNRAGSTLTGLTMGTVAFLMGDGRYGIFEILKHITPGVITDLLVPSMIARGRQPGALAWSALGGIIGAGRFATIFAITLAVQAPAIAWAMLAPGITVHVTFGVLSGYFTHHLVRVVRRDRSQAPHAERKADEPAGQG